MPARIGNTELRGRIVTIDALGCPKAIAQAILEREAQYVLALKGNQGRLYQEVQDLFAGAEEFGYQGVPHDYANTLNRNHGRVEWRERRVINDPLSPAYLSAGQSWPGLKSVVRVVGHRETAEGSTVQPRCCISSLTAPAEPLLAAVRTHRSSENSLHRSLDGTFREDQCRIRRSHAPQNLATLRQISRNLLKRETSLRVGLRGKRRQASGRDAHLLKVLRS